MSKAKQPFAAGADKPPIRTLSATAFALPSDAMDTPLGNVRTSSSALGGGVQDVLMTVTGASHELAK